MNNKIICKICETQNPKIIYTGKLRTGFAGFTDNNTNVYQCTNCNTIFHNYTTFEGGGDSMNRTSTVKMPPKSYYWTLSTHATITEFWKK